MKQIQVHAMIAALAITQLVNNINHADTAQWYTEQYPGLSFNEAKIKDSTEYSMYERVHHVPVPAVNFYQHKAVLRYCKKRNCKHELWK